MSVGTADPISDKLGHALRSILCNGVKIQAVKLVLNVAVNEF